MHIVKLWDRNALSSTNEYPCASDASTATEYPIYWTQAAALQISIQSCHIIHPLLHGDDAVVSTPDYRHVNEISIQRRHTSQFDKN